MASGVFGGVTLSVTLWLPMRLLEIVMVTFCGVVTFDVSTLNLTLVIPATMPTATGRERLPVGTLTTEGLLLEIVRGRLPEGATAPGARLTSTNACVPPTTLAGAIVILPNASEEGARPVVFSRTVVPPLLPLT